MTEARRLTPEQENQIAKLLEGAPHHREILLNSLREKGIDTREFEPISFEEEGKAAIGGLAQSFGFDPPPGTGETEVRAGDVNLPFGIGRVQPSRLAGQLTPEAVGVGVAGKVLKGVKAAGKLGIVGREAIKEGTGGLVGGVAAEIGQKNKPLAQRLIDIGINTGAGVALGAGGAKIVEAAASAGRKLLKGEVPTPTEAEALRTAAAKAEVPMPELDVQDVQVARDATAASIAPKVDPKVAGAFRAADAANDPNRASLPAVVGNTDIVPAGPVRTPAPRFGGLLPEVEAPKQLGPVKPGGTTVINDQIVELSNGARIGRQSVEEAATRIEEIAEPLYTDLELAQTSSAAQVRALRAIEAGAMQPDEMQFFFAQTLLSGKLNRAQQIERLKGFAPEPEVGGKVPDVTAEAIPSKKAPPPKPLQTEALRNRVSGAEAPAILDRTVRQDVPDAVRSGTMRAETGEKVIAEASRKGEDLGGPGTGGGPQPRQAPDPNVIGRADIGGLEGQSVVLTLNNGEEVAGVIIDHLNPQTLRLQRAEGAIHVRIKDIQKATGLPGGRGASDLDLSTPPSEGQRRKFFALVDDVKGLGGKAKAVDPNTINARQMRDKIDELELERTRLTAAKEDAEFEELMKLGGQEDTVADKLKNKPVNDPSVVSNPEWARDTGATYAMFLTPEYSRRGLAANPLGKATLDAGIQMADNIEVKTKALLSRASSALRGMDVKQKFNIVRALDGNTHLLARFPEIKEAHDQIREIFNEVADMLKLRPEERVRDYFPHIFAGERGGFRAIQLAQEMGVTWAERMATRAGVPDRINLGRLDVETGIPLQKFFANTLKRSGVDGYDFDLDRVIYAYISGAVRKVEGDAYLKKARANIANIPVRDQLGRKLEIRKYLTDHVAYVVGQPVASRNLMARFFQDSAVFNAGVDWMVDWVGDAPERGLMAKARRAEELATKLRNKTATNAERTEYMGMDLSDAADWLEALAKNKDDLPKGRKVRRQVARQLDLARRALGNPTNRGLVVGNIYRMMILSKLGLNLAHGLINMTQTVTNTWAALDTRHVAKGVTALMNQDRPMLGGRTGRQISQEAGEEAGRFSQDEFLKRGDQGGFGDLSSDIDAIRAGEGILQKGAAVKQFAERLALQPAELSEKFNRRIAVLSAYNQKMAELGVKPGKAATQAQHDAALAFGREMVTKTQFRFDRVGRPRILRSPGMRLLLQFFSYPIFQTNFAADLIGDVLRNPKSKNAWSALGKHTTAYAGLYAASGFGSTQFFDRVQPPALDIFEGFGSDDPFQDRDAFDLMSGPMGAALLHAIRGDFAQSASEFEPSISRRIKAVSEGESVARIPFGSLFEAPFEPRKFGGPPKAP